MDVSNSKNIFLLILFLLLVLGVFVFMVNPYHILDRFKLSIIFIFFVLCFGTFYFIESHFKEDTSETLPESLSLFLYHFLRVGKFVIFAIVVTWAFLLIYRQFVETTTTMLEYSFFLTMGFFVLLLAVLYRGDSAPLNSPIMRVIIDFIMYIPCLLRDLVDYMKKDYANTPSTTFILLVVLIFYVILFFVFPEIQKEWSKQDGVTLIERPVTLQEASVSMNRNELYEKIFYSKPFYERWTRQIVVYLEQNDIKNQKAFSEKRSELEKDILKEAMIESIREVGSNREGFTTLETQDSQSLYGWYNTLERYKQLIFQDMSKDINPELNRKLEEWKEYKDKVKKNLQDDIRNSPQLLGLVDALQILYSTVRASGDTILTIPYVLLGKPSVIDGNMYHYSCSFWVYFNTLEFCADKQLIVSFGTKPSLFYTPSTQELSVEINHEEGTNNKQLYKTKKVLYQRWNHIVFNYQYGILDLFINNNLVGTYNALTQMYSDELIRVGSTQNQNVGGICNMKYYEYPLTADKIQKIYQQFQNKTPPI